MLNNRLKRHTAIVAVAMVVLVMSGCKETVPASSQSKSPDTSSKSVVEQDNTSQSESTSSNSTTDLGFDADGLPVMTEENKILYDKYLKPLEAAYPLFLYPFSENQFNVFSTGIIYSCLTNSTQNTKVNAENVEMVIRQCFDISEEQMKVLSGREYTKNDNSYLVVDISSIGTRAHKGIVTESNMDGDMLNLTCEWFQSSHPDEPGTFKKRTTSTLTIKVVSDLKWKYISNESTLKYGEKG